MTCKSGRYHVTWLIEADDQPKGTRKLHGSHVQLAPFDNQMTGPLIVINPKFREGGEGHLPSLPEFLKKIAESEVGVGGGRGGSSIDLVGIAAKAS